jgi:hypothetical protein
VGVIFHEAWHCAAALHNGVRVLTTTAVRDGNADGRTTMMLDRKECPTINAFISIAAEEGDKKCGSNLDPATYEGDRDIGGSLEWREGIRQSVIEQLPQFAGGAMEIARALMAKRTLTAFEIRSAFIRGQRRAREEHATMALPTGGRVIREWNFSNQQDLIDWNKRRGRKPDAEPLGTAPGYIAARNKSSD